MNECSPTHVPRKRIGFVAKLGWILMTGSLVAILPLVTVGCTKTDKTGAKGGPGGGNVPTGDTVKVGILHSLSGTMAISETSLKDVELMAIEEINAGDVVLLRTGWAQYWNDPVKYIREVRGPGPELAGAEWLSSHGIFAAGSDTIAFEKVPARNMPVHVHLLVEKGIHIIEALDLEQLARDGVAEFLFIAAPLKIRGGTGSPVRALALVT